MEAKALARTVEDHELLDPELTSADLAWRLFNERGVMVYPARPIREACRCSDARIEDMLRNFTEGERNDMVGDDGRITVTCEFCSTRRSYDPAEFQS
jgi:molecular chaperone Hsp33